MSLDILFIQVLEEVAVELGSALIQSLIKTVRHPAGERAASQAFDLVLTFLYGLFVLEKG